MGEDQDVAYYRRRAIEHLTAAKGCSNEQARQCHLQFAEAYQRRIKEIEADGRRSAIHVAQA